MGLFSRLFGGKNEAEAPDDDGPTPEYALAHLALRQIALAEPLQFLAILASPKANDFLNDIIANVGEVGGTSADFTADDLTIDTTRVGGYPCVIIQLAPPKEMAEAHFVALVALLPPGSDVPPEGSDVPGRYFTLEKGFNLEGDVERTVLCEWTLDRHINFGDGPPATSDDFATAIAAQLE